MVCSALMKRAAPRCLLLIAILSLAASASAQLASDTEQQIAQAAESILQKSGVPSASVGIVVNGRIAYTRAFGLARIHPPEPAQASMAYPIGSISKQFTATAVLLLEQQGKLKLDDTVGKYLPGLTEGDKVTIRNLLTHTSGYQDYAPQDYTIPTWKHPVDPMTLVTEYAGKPLDFQPGTKWQYSNTNFVVAAMIVQKVSGEPFATFLRDHVLQPTGLKDVLNLSTERRSLQVSGYMRNALAPVRPAALEAPGWYFGDADLAMPSATLLKWDISVTDRTLLSAKSYDEMETPFILKDGRNTHYGLGLFIQSRDGYPMLEHDGEVGGFVAENLVISREHTAIDVLTNQEASDAASEIAQAILPIILKAGKSAPSEVDTFAPKLKAILSRLQEGRIDRSLFTADCNAYFNQDALHDFASSLAPLGGVTSVTQTRSALRGGMRFGLYQVSFTKGTSVLVSIYLEPNGKIEQLLVVGKG
jgi:D-alanyl-D-alanine carboxypeptidase